MNSLFAGVSAYILVQFVIGLFASRRQGNETDYILAGRSNGPNPKIFTVFATWYGAESVIGAPGLIYKDGFSGFYILFILPCPNNQGLARYKNHAIQLSP